MHTPLPEPCSCMNESGASAGNSWVRVIPLDLEGMDSKSGPGTEVRDWLKRVADKAGTSGSVGVDCAQPRSKRRNRGRPKPGTLQAVSRELLSPLDRADQEEPDQHTEP